MPVHWPGVKSRIEIDGIEKKPLRNNISEIINSDHS